MYCQHCPNLVYFLIRYFLTVANTALQPPSWISLVSTYVGVWAGLNIWFSWGWFPEIWTCFLWATKQNFFVAIVFLSLRNAIETIKSLFFQTCSLEKCTHIQGRNYHNPFAVTLSTNAMFTDVLHLRVIDPAHYTCTLLWWALRWIRGIRTQSFHWLIDLTIMLRLFHLMKPRLVTRMNGM